MIVLIKGAGDLASGVAHRLRKAAFSVVMTDIEEPTAIRRTVSFCQAVYDHQVEVEGIKGIHVNDEEEALRVVAKGDIPILIDPGAISKEILKPHVIVDAILAKRNLGTTISDADIVIALGPGFTAGIDAHAVIETKRGHDLGRVYLEGTAIPNTGIPGEVGGKSIERLLRASADGIFMGIRKIGDFVKVGDIVATCGGVPLKSQIDGYLRGILYDGLPVEAGMKVGDVDPRCERYHCFTISDKARALGGAVLEAILYFDKMKDKSELPKSQTNFFRWSLR